MLLLIKWRKDMKLVKLIIKIFNCVIMAISAVATIFLFASPSLSFNSRIDVDVKKFSEFVPKTEYSENIDIAYLLGTETISVGLKFKISAGDLSKTTKGDKERINELFINENVDNIVDELHTPVELITDFTIRSVMESMIEAEITKYVDQARQDFEEKHPTYPKTTTEDIMSSASLNTAYFHNFALALYDASNADDASFTKVNDVLFQQIDEALNKAKKSGAKIDNTSFNESKKDTIKESLKTIYGQLNLVKEDNEHLEKISQISYVYLTKFVKERLSSKEGFDTTILEQKSGEELRDYSDRLLGELVRNEMPDVFYQVIKYVSIGLFVGLFLFTLTWVGLLLFTAYRTFLSKKTWTIFGPLFWLSGLLQLVLGFGITYAFKVVIPTKLDIASLNLPISNVLLAPRTYALVPSILFMVCIVLGIAYLVLKILFKKPLKEFEANKKEA